MICACCFSDEIELNPLGLREYAACNECGFLFTVNNSKNNTRESILQYYQKEDPHRAVAYSKKNFFDSTLRYLSSKIDKAEKTILDVGCGHGYFIDYASKKGWTSLGVEIVNEAAESARGKIGKEKIIEGKLKEVNFYGNSFDAITLWDVLAIVDDTHDELIECFRILRKGGTIGIRTRNVLFQKLVHQLYRPFKQIGLRFGLKEPYVFNRYCFSSKSLHILLSRIGYANIKITNSPLTLGDPYNHSNVSGLISAGKILIGYLAQLVFWISAGKWKIGSSLLVWAEKPRETK